MMLSNLERQGNGKALLCGARTQDGNDGLGG